MTSTQEIDALLEQIKAWKAQQEYLDSLIGEKAGGAVGAGECPAADCDDVDEETAEEEFFRVLGDLLGAGVSPDKAAELALAFTIWDFAEEY